MDFQLTLLILTGLITALMALYVFMRSPQGEVQQAYIILISFFVLWAFLTSIVYSTSDLVLAAILERVTYVLGLGIAWAFLNFAKKFPYKINQISNAFQIVFALLSVILFFPIVSPNGILTAVLSGMDIHDKFVLTNFYWLALYIVFSLVFSVALRKAMKMICF